MSLFFASLNSGSNGNCYYIGNNDAAILVDAGIHCRQIEERLERLDLSIGFIKGIVISHEHTDHIKGLEALATKYNLPVYITVSTLQYSRLKIPQRLINLFSCGDDFNVGGLKVITFAKQHDAADPCSIVVEHEAVRFGVFTDIGEPCKDLIANFKNCHAALLEANYDENMLYNGKYPFFLKKRISGSKGHLSNNQALELFINHKPPFMSHLFLAHLSQHNNCPILVESLFTTHAGDVNIVVTSRDKESNLYKISLTEEKMIPVNTFLRKKLLASQLQFMFE